MEVHGTLQADQIASLSFPISGKLNSIAVHLGQQITKGQPIATLASGLYQSYLDRALRTYDKVRADFDAETAKKPPPEKQRLLQDDLDIAVKNVEIAKANMDDTALLSPIDGVVANIEPTGIVPGVAITPSRFTITILSLSALSFVGYVHEQERWGINAGTGISILVTVGNKTIPGTITYAAHLPESDNTYRITAHLNDPSGLFPGLSAIARW